MNNIKLIALDLDGTVIKNDHDVSTEDEQAVKAAVKAGIYVTIATGRSYYSAKTWADRFNINAPVISCNGGRIRGEKDILFSKALEKDKLKEILAASKHVKGRRYLFAKDRIYCTPEGKNEKFFIKNGYYKTVGNLIIVCDNENALLKEAGDATNKLLIIADDENEHKKLLESVKDIKDCEKVVGDVNNIEVTAKGITKAAALLHLAKTLGIKQEETMAIGDSENDIKIIKAAGIGAAMGNAMDIVKEAADIVLPGIDENGVAYAIKKFVL